eukprot:TRINITY_DN2598_c0_g1_i1.p2 TRINITY_DN2598_c0_g1~~TRINITY_DN2598_c0_g1_i1.p2  ORF type:complete len:129 (+),score=13.91 TRINITY_DN2598_c0_g1_i1:360-746(+)
MALPPCHILSQFYVTKNQRDQNVLSSCLFQRSADMGLGVPFNVASYSLLTNILAKICNYEPGEFVHFIGDAHVYKNHIPQLTQQIQRIPFTFPRLEIKRSNQIDNYNAKDFELKGYRHHKKIQMEMAV